MKNKKYLFLCSTQYTIFNSINAVLNNIEGCKGNSDIIIFHITDDIKNISKRIKDSKIFNNVYDFPFINKMNVFLLLMLFVFPKVFLNKLCLNDKHICLMKNQYNVLISQNQLYASLFRRIYKNVDVYFVEEGLSSYTNRTVDPQRRSIYFRLANKVFFHETLLSDVKKQLLYNLEMYSGDIVKIKKLPMRKSEDNIFYNQIFEYRDNVLYDSHKFVYLGARYYGIKKLMKSPKEASEDFEDNCRFIVESMMKVSKKTNFIYRTHPTENIDEDYYEKYCKFDKCQNMWEIECQNAITDNHILVSFFSTASFTPKMLYGKEPYVIFLYKILGVEFLNADELVFRLQSIYTNPQKIILPENLDELLAIIEKLDLL